MPRHAIGEIFGRAADHLEDGSWRWMNASGGSIGDGDHDLFLAICRAAAELDMREHARAAIDLMQGQLGARLTVWNDRPGRTAGDVVTALRQAAAWYANPAEDDPAVLPMALGNLAAPACELAPPFLPQKEQA